MPPAKLPKVPFNAAPLAICCQQRCTLDSRVGGVAAGAGQWLVQRGAAPRRPARLVQPAWPEPPVVAVAQQWTECGVAADARAVCLILPLGYLARSR